MSQSLRHPLTDLPRDRTLRIADGRAHVVAVFEGQVWLTHDGDSRDVFLEAGDSFTFDRPGVTLVQAMRDARLLVSDPASLERTGVESALLRAAQRVSTFVSALAHRPLRAH
jgi:hypothetical protein